MGELRPDRIDAETGGDGAVPVRRPAVVPVTQEPRCRISPSRVREAVDRALRTGRGVREVGVQYGFSKSCVDRHRAHVAPDLVDAKAEIAKIDALLGSNGVVLALK